MTVTQTYTGVKLWKFINRQFRFCYSTWKVGSAAPTCNVFHNPPSESEVIRGPWKLRFRQRSLSANGFQKCNLHVTSTTANAMPTSVSNGSGASFQRLPLKVIPSNYDLTFEPDWTCHRFEAVAVIDVEVKEQTDAVILNANNFSISEIAFKGTNNDAQEADVFVLDIEQELLKITFAKPLVPGEGQLTIKYSGKVADNLKGLFRSKYEGPNGEPRYHYLTKFEPTFARNCFPCWDEPSIKATYDITLIVPKHLVAVSNMPVKEDLPHSSNIDKKVVTFERSVKMSTYVMAFAIGEFDYVEKATRDGILCRVYTPVGKKERGNFALEVVIKSLAFYKNYFDIPYPLPKMDLLGVTEFGSGAMENFGLVIFREQNLLMDEKLSSSTTKQYVAIVMWFGNLVTMEWWDDLWLNEGFASWIEYYCVHDSYPDFQIWNLFMGDYIQALELDASATSHPIQAKVEDPAQIGAIFDYISYVKGAAVIRMIHDYIGDEKFREGISYYLKQHLFGNAETKDLWAALTEKSGEKVDVIMPTFTEQMGFPVLTVKDIKQVDGKKTITISYQKFWTDATSKDNKTYKWITPITVRNQSDPTGIAYKTVAYEEPNIDFALTVDSKDGEWVKLNADHVGYYRVTYPSSILEKFIASIKNKEMQPLDRMGILDDLFANVKAGHASSHDVLQLLLAYKDEDVYAVWSGILKIISSVDTLLRDSQLKEKFQTFARNLIAPIAARLGWDEKENERPQDSLLRTAILIKLVSLNCTDAIEEAKSRFGKHIRGEKTISPDIRSAVYRAMAMEGESGFDALMKVYGSTDLLEEKMRLLAALGAVKDKGVIQKVLEFGRSSQVNMQDIVSIVISMSNHGKQDMCWEYFKENWQFFRDSFPTGGFIIRRVVDSVTANFNTEEKAVEIETFFKEHQIKGIERTLSQSLESIRINKAWLERDTSSLQQFLSSY